MHHQKVGSVAHGLRGTIVKILKKKIDRSFPKVHKSFGRFLIISEDVRWFLNLVDNVTSDWTLVKSEKISCFYIRVFSSVCAQVLYIDSRGDLVFGIKLSLYNIKRLKTKRKKSYIYATECTFFKFVVIRMGGAVVSWLVRSSPDRAVRVRALAGDIALCSWARHFTLTVPLSTQVYKWVPANLMLGVFLRWTSIPSRG